MFSTTNPYFTPEGISRTLDVSLSHRQAVLKTRGQLHQLSLPPGPPCVLACLPARPTRCLWRRAGADPHQARHKHPPPTCSMPTKFGYSSMSIPLTVGWSRDDQDSSSWPNSVATSASIPEWSAWRAMRAMCGPTTEYQQYIPLSKRFTIAFNGRGRLRQGGTAAHSSVQELSTRAVWARCVVSDQGCLGPRDVTGASLGGPQEDHTEHRADCSLSQGGQ